MYEYLKGHPEVFLPEFKEPSYFAADLALDKSGNFLRYPQDEARYYDLFAEAGSAKGIGEGSTRYLYSADAPGLIAAASPHARIVAMVRSPIDMMHSLHAHKLAAGTEDLEDFGAALDAEQDRREGRRIPASSNPRLATYTDRARFGHHIQRWIDAFGRDRVHIVVFEDMVRDPEGQFRTLLEFLGLSPDFRPPSFAARNVAHGARSRLLRRLLNSGPVQFLVWKVIAPLIGEARTRSLAQRFGRLSRKPIDRGTVDPQIRLALEAQLEDDVVLLSSIVGRDLRQLWFGDRQPLSGS